MFWKPTLPPRVFSPVKAESDEYRAACRLWMVYVQTRNEFVQPGDGDDDDDDDMLDNTGLSTEDEVGRLVVHGVKGLKKLRNRSITDIYRYLPTCLPL